MHPIRLAIVIIVCTLIATARGAEGDATVRNRAPQAASAVVDTHSPIYWPRSLGKPPAEASAESPEHLLRAFFNLHSAMRYDEALPVARRLVEAVPGRALPEYNLACVLGRLRRTRESLAALERAVDCGWRDARYMRFDPDLDPVREDAAFASLLARIRSLEDAEAVPARPLRDDPWPQVAREISERAPSLLERFHVPGAAVALIRDGACVWTGLFGVGDSRTGAPLTLETVYRLDAPSDLVTLLAAADLDAAGKLDLGRLLLRCEEMVGARALDGVPTWTVQRPVRSRTVANAFGSARESRRSGGPTAVGRGASRLDRWPTATEAGEARSLLHAAVEIAARRSFADACRDRVFDPLALTSTGLAGAGPAGAGPTGAGPTRANPTPQRCAGHSRLGTPIDVSASASGAFLETTIGDLATLAARMIDAEASVARSTAPLDRVAGLLELDLSRMGLRLFSDETPHGRRIQVGGVGDGVGCLMRWYPERGCGVVVVFNAESGREAAVRLAHLALGGS